MLGQQSTNGVGHGGLLNTDDFANCFRPHYEMNCFGESDIVGTAAGEPMDHHHSTDNGYVATADSLGVGSGGEVAVGRQYTSVIVEPTSFQMSNEYVH